ncbi:unnamed protein product [Penicillium roqueforti FM164]|uniref:Genomic scaffold, ProqFM164S01 n=1 Tax=Penicillium roqueforti (strain FM164) TaxID=1365484 RepID=W6Q131_PENRF|nr:unnamed protein product [Penicillium roqueforti FM164]
MKLVSPIPNRTDKLNTASIHIHPHPHNKTPGESIPTQPSMCLPN